MSVALELRSSRNAKPAGWEFGLWLLLALPVIALSVWLAIGSARLGGVHEPDFGYAEWSQK